MKVLKTGTSNQTFTFIPRDYVTTATLILRDDSTNESTSVEATFTKTGDYLSYTGSFDLKEGRFYDLQVQTDGDFWDENIDQWQLVNYDWDDENYPTAVVYRDKIFVTDQTIDQNDQKEYTINKDEYKSDKTFDNDYIIL
jgi:hypothetical protein